MADRNKETVLDSLAKAKTNLLEALAKSQSNTAVSKAAVRKIEKLCGEVESLQLKIKES